MNDDCMAHIYDEHGKKRKLSTEEMLTVYASLLRAIYIEVMVACPTLKHDSFRKGHLDFVRSVIDSYDDTYADHIEGCRKVVLDKMAEDD